MTQFSFTKFVDSTGSEHLEPLTDSRIAELTGMKEERVWKATLTKTRSILKKGSTPFDLALETVQTFLRKTGIQSDQIGGLALLHTHYGSEIKVAQDIANRVAESIGFNRERVLGMTFGCSGFPEIVRHATLLSEGMQDNEHMIIATAEAPETMADPKDTRATPLFAAGAAATSLWRGNGHKLIFAETKIATPPDNPENVEIFKIGNEVVSDFYGGEPALKTIFRMDGDLAYKNGMALIIEAAWDSLDEVMKNPAYHGRNVYVVPHQPNGKMLNFMNQYTAPEMKNSRPQYGIKNICFVNGMTNMGNTISSTIPMVLANIDSIPGITAPETGDIILFPAAGICVEFPGTKMSQGLGAMEW